LSSGTPASGLAGNVLTLLDDAPYRRHAPCTISWPKESFKVERRDDTDLDDRTVENRTDTGESHATTGGAAAAGAVTGGVIGLTGGPIVRQLAPLAARLWAPRLSE